MHQHGKQKEQPPNIFCYVYSSGLTGSSVSRFMLVIAATNDHIA